MAEQTIALVQSRYGQGLGSGARGWFLSSPLGPDIIDELDANPAHDQEFEAIWVTSSGDVELRIHNTTTLSVGNLSDLFESSGSVEFTIGSHTILVALNGADMNEPYLWTPDNSAEVITFFNEVPAADGSTSGSVTLRDYVPVRNLAIGGDLAGFALGPTAVDRAYIGATEGIQAMSDDIFDGFTQSLKKNLNAMRVGLVDEAVAAREAMRTDLSGMVEKVKSENSTSHTERDDALSKRVEGIEAAMGERTDAVTERLTEHATATLDQLAAAFRSELDAHKAGLDARIEAMSRSFADQVAALRAEERTAMERAWGQLVRDLQVRVKNVELDQGRRPRKDGG